MKRDPHFLRPARGVERSSIKKSRRYRLVILLAFFLLIIAVGFSVLAYRFLTDSSSFQVRNIIVEGAEFADRERVIEAVRSMTDRNVLLVDLNEVYAAVTQIPWVANVEARKVLPDSLHISITEHLPTAYVIIGSELYLTNATGIIIDRSRPEHPFTGLPVIRGVDGIDAGEVAERLRLCAGILEELKQLRPLWYQRLSEIDVSTPDSLRVRLLDVDFDIIVGDEDVISRLEKYFSVEGELQQRYDTIDYVDLRFDRRLYVKPVIGEGIGQAP